MGNTKETDMTKKIIEHPNTRLVREIEEQKKEIQALKIDVVVLRDLLLRTVRMLAQLEMTGAIGKPKERS